MRILQFPRAEALMILLRSRETKISAKKWTKSLPSLPMREIINFAVLSITLILMTNPSSAKAMKWWISSPGLFPSFSVPNLTSEVTKPAVMISSVMPMSISCAISQQRAAKARDSFTRLPKFRASLQRSSGLIR